MESSWGGIPATYTVLLKGPIESPCCSMTSLQIDRGAQLDHSSGDNVIHAAAVQIETIDI